MGAEGVAQSGTAIVAMLGSSRLWSDVGVVFDKFMRLIGGRRSRYLTEGARGGEVARLQGALNRAEFLNPNPTGYFGKQTKAAVLDFQRAHGLRVDGIVGPQTQKALGRY